MGRTKRDTPIDATRAPELLDVDPSNEPSEAVANEIDSAATNVCAQVLSQRSRGLLDTLA